MRKHLYFLAAFLCWVSCLTTLTAQNGLYDIRFITQSFSCDSSKVIVAAQVRATDIEHTFNMGDANYRFSYDPRLVNTPRIVSQEHFSNISPSNDFNYGTQNLLGSSVGLTRGIVSLNTFYTGVAGTARRVDTTWTTISLIGFNVVRGADCFTLTWHNELIFPNTNMNEVELLTNGDYNLYIVRSGGFYGNLEECYQINCVSGTSPTVVETPLVTKQDLTATVCMPIVDPDTGSVFTATVCAIAQHGIANPTIVPNIGNSNSQLCVQYTPNTSFTGMDSVCITVCDNTNKCINIKIPITVNLRPSPPTVNTIVPIITKQDSTVMVCMPITDPDTGSIFRVSLCNIPRQGEATLSVVGNQLCVTYVPTANFAVSDEICVLICDNTGLCSNLSIPVTIQTRPHAPVVTLVPILTKADSSVMICMPITDIDANSSFTATICGEARHGSMTPSVNGNQLCVAYTPTAGFWGTDSVCIAVCDNTGLCTIVIVPITIKERFDGRVLVGIRKRLSPLQPLSVRLGGAVNYQITVKNNANFTLHNVLVRDSIPTGMVLNQSNPQGWASVGDFKMATKIIPSIEAGDSVTLDISLILLYGTPRTFLTNRAFVFDAADQFGDPIISSGEEPLDTAAFMVKPFDPMGVIYCDNTGFILQGGHIELVAAPSGGSIFFATDSLGTVLDGTNGHYQFFTNGVPGRYQVRYVHPRGYPLSTRCTPNDTPLDPTNNDGDTNDANRDGVIDKDGLVNDHITLGSNMVNNNHLESFACANNPYWLTFDLATDDPFIFNNNIPIACAVIAGTTGTDTNENGLFDNTETPLSGVNVHLYHKNDLNTPIASTQTDNSGQYIFDGLTQDTYRLKFISPSGHRFTIANVNNNTFDANDSDADSTGFTAAIALDWGSVDTTIAAHFVPTNINPPTMTGWHIATVEDSVLNICLPILDNTPTEMFTPSVCGVQNGILSNLAIVGRQFCFRYTPNLGYRGDDTLCLRVCDRDGQCDTARFTLDIQAKNNRFDCRGDGVAPVISFTNNLLRGVGNGDTLTYLCTNAPVFTVQDAQAVDNIDPNPSLRFNDAGIKQGNCTTDGYKVIIECNWTATDSCGNTSIIQIFIKITDNIRPILPTIPADTTIDINANQTIPNAPTLSATDNCGVATVMLRTDSLATGMACNYVLTRTWTATDECNNTSTGSQSITVLRACPCVLPAVTFTKTDATCGNANGTATINVDSAANYTFTWSNGGNTSSVGTNLQAGNYSVTVSRVQQLTCQAVVNITILNDTSNCCTDFIPQPSLLAAVNGCNNLLDVCIPMTNIDISSITDSILLYTGGLMRCTDGLSLKLNVGSHPLIFRTTTGCLDTIQVKVVCTNAAPMFIETTLLVGTKDSIQLQTNELYGSRFTLRQIRATATGAVNYTNLAGTMVITRTANQAGVEYATYIVSDEYGITDTTYIRTEVVLRTSTRRPLALDDKIESPKGKALLIDIMNNDSIIGTFRSLSIIIKPQRGSALLTADNRIIYTPNTDFCGNDQLSYLLCNPNGCDTADVKITYMCEGVNIFNGFSPNGDNLNDNFVIEGIENYPNNVLTIYNRWGNNILTVKDYKNDWQGTWQGTHLPDGTYYYIFDDGEGKIYKGYVVLQR